MQSLRTPASYPLLIGISVRVHFPSKNPEQERTDSEDSVYIQQSEELAVARHQPRKLLSWIREESRGGAPAGQVLEK